MPNSSEDKIILEAYTKVRSSVILENLDPQREQALTLVGQIVRLLNTTHDSQFPEELFGQLREVLNQIKSAEATPTAPATPNLNAPPAPVATSAV